MNRVAIFGAGGMGTALALLASKKAESVALWCREGDQAERIQSSRENAKHLPGVRLPDAIEATADFARAVRGAELLIVAVPSAYLRSTLASVSRLVPRGVPCLSVVKGIENGTFARPSRIITEIWGDRPVAVLSGPSHAEELARGLPASVVVAGENDALNLAVRDLLNEGMFRVYINDDPIGVELAGALKNIVGIASGVCDGLELGDNAKAALITRGLVEIARFAIALGGRSTTFAGLAGIGDVVTTCYSGYGRNHALGVRIGRGETLDEALAASSGVAEGVPTAKSVHAQAISLAIDMPITAQLHAVLFEGKSPVAALSDLMVRLPKVEWC